MNKFTNSLIHETSPYLLQHAYNPVNWLPWNQETLELAQKSDKLIIVSIGYSACHWCHVMEHESFENEDIANIMNQHFICIKVDREERPDVDAIYMDSVQAMGIRGGWPLNVFLMPDTKPFYGGTYFKPNDWASICMNIKDAYVNNRMDLQKSAEGFTNNMKVSESEKYGLTADGNQINTFEIERIVNNLLVKHDRVWGGMVRAPKFPMPNIWSFLVSFLKSSKNIELNKNVYTALETTLNKMAMGGIFDQIGGGFSRYSVDSEWFLPHFEKMLYDNAQLLSLYSEAYLYSKDKYFLEVIVQTIDWLKRDMLSNEGGFYSAQDADSEGIEGKFYVWKKTDVMKFLPETANLFCEKYQVTQKGNWEEGQNILWKNEKFLNEEFKNEIEILLKERNKRIFPGLDDKMLCSWNGLMLKGLADAYNAVQKKEFLVLANNCAYFIINKFYSKGNLFHSYKNNITKIEGFLEDYACTISGFIALYQVDFDEKWLAYSETLMLTAYENFYIKEENFFTLTDKRSEKLIATKIDLFDNVIPSGNSMMAHNLYNLGVLLSREDFVGLAKAMVNKMKNLIIENSDYLANWAALANKINQPKVEIVIYGNGACEKQKELLNHSLPMHYVLVSEVESSLDLFKNRWPKNDIALIYLCIDNVCGLPLISVNEAVNQLKTI